MSLLTGKVSLPCRAAEAQRGEPAVGLPRPQPRLRRRAKKGPATMIEEFLRACLKVMPGAVNPREPTKGGRHPLRTKVSASISRPVALS